MAKPGAEVEGLKELLKDLDGAPLRTRVAVRRTLAQLTREARDEVKAAVPVDEGDLKRSIAVKGAKPVKERFSYAVISRTTGGKTGSGHHYHLVEYGTAKMRARRFAAPVRQKYTGPGGASRMRTALATVTAKELLKKGK